VHPTSGSPPRSGRPGLESLWKSSSFRTPGLLWRWHASTRQTQPCAIARQFRDLQRSEPCFHPDQILRTTTLEVDVNCDAVCTSSLVGVICGDSPAPS
jgi:hypothetical protein